MQLAAAQHRYQTLHEKKPYHDGALTEDGHFANWSEKASELFPYHWSDGTSIFVAPVDLGMGGDFLEQGEAPLVDEPGD